MEAPSPVTILVRAIYLIILIIAVLFIARFVKTKQRISAITAELQSITSDSSFFQQFYAEDARKSLVRAIGLIAEANTLGVDPETAIKRALGIKEKFYDTGIERDEPTAREKIIRSCLRSNYENFIKLGFTEDTRTLNSLKAGELPPIPTGPQSGKRPIIATLISPAISPGMEKVIANLEIRPPETESRKLTDIETAAAKQLAHDLSEAKIIEEPARDRIIQGLATQVP